MKKAMEEQFVKNQEAALKPEAVELARSAFAHAREINGIVYSYHSFLVGFLYGFTAGSESGADNARILYK